MAGGRDGGRVAELAMAAWSGEHSGDGDSDAGCDSGDGGVNIC